MAIDRKKFFDTIRPTLFDGRLSQSQVTGITVFLDFWEKGYATADLRWLAYILGTTHHETDRRMRPIEEYGKGQGLSYGMTDPQTHQKYYGRGYVQITHRDNYEKMAEILHVQLVQHPELALDPKIAIQIIFYGMTHGTFTGKKLKDYFTPTKHDWTNARRIVNGTDKASLVAGYAKHYFDGLRP